MKKKCTCGCDSALCTLDPACLPAIGLPSLVAHKPLHRKNLLTSQLSQGLQLLQAQLLHHRLHPRIDRLPVLLVHIRAIDQLLGTGLLKGGIDQLPTAAEVLVGPVGAKAHTDSWVFGVRCMFGRCVLTAGVPLALLRVVLHHFHKLWGGRAIAGAMAQTISAA